jgi:hypothetical protein
MFHKAVGLDIAEQYEHAAELYELVIKEENPPVDAFLNLAVLYWECTDFGIMAGYHLPVDFVKKAHVRHEEVLVEAKERFAEFPEVTFWQRYIIDYRGMRTDFSVDDAIYLTTRPNSTLVPYFYIYLASQRSSEYRPLAMQLFEDAHLSKTTKNRYIISMLEGEFE